MRKYIVAILLAGGVIATPAVAQDQGNFSGPRIEGIVGYDRLHAEGDSTDGVLYGSRVGYDFRSGRAIFGVDGEVTGSTSDECVNDFAAAGDRLCVSAGRDLYAGGRIGAVLSPNIELYGTLGYTNARVKASYEDGTAGTALDFRDSRNLDGVRAGVGLQLALSRNVFATTEYRYSNYEDGVNRNQVVGGIGIRF
jgi:outer membrane immunogenic protein